MWHATADTQRQATVGQSEQTMMYSQPYSPQALDRTHSNSINIPNTVGRVGFHTNSSTPYIYTENWFQLPWGAGFTFCSITSRDRQWHAARDWGELELTPHVREVQRARVLYIYEQRQPAFGELPLLWRPIKNRNIYTRWHDGASTITLCEPCTEVRILSP